MTFKNNVAAHVYGMDWPLATVADAVGFLLAHQSAGCVILYEGDDDNPAEVRVYNSAWHQRIAGEPSSELLAAIAAAEAAQAAIWKVLDAS